MTPETKVGPVKRIITFGTFDLFHIGHLNILRRARELGDELIVGVSSDELNFQKKNRYPVFSQEQRMAIVRAIRYVDAVFLEESLELKSRYVREWSASCLVMGHDWEGKFDYLRELCEVVYLPRTEAVSSTEIKQTIRNLLD